MITFVVYKYDHIMKIRPNPRTPARELKRDLPAVVRAAIITKLGAKPKNN